MLWFQVSLATPVCVWGWVCGWVGGGGWWWVVVGGGGVCVCVVCVWCVCGVCVVCVRTDVNVIVSGFSGYDCECPRGYLCVYCDRCQCYCFRFLWLRL